MKVVEAYICMFFRLLVQTRLLLIYLLEEAVLVGVAEAAASEEERFVRPFVGNVDCFSGIIQFDRSLVRSLALDQLVLGDACATTGAKRSP